MGVIPVGTGFRLEAADLAILSIDESNVPATIRRYKTGRDVAEGADDRLIIDFFGKSLEEARSASPELLQLVLDRVKPERENCKRSQHREKWWIFGDARPAMRRALGGLVRFIATVETAKHRFFVFLDAGVLRPGS